MRRVAPHRLAGFTLVEVLLVLAIIGIITAVTAPTFVRSIRGNRLQAGARAVVMAGKYCRSMAVLQQKSFVLSFVPVPEGTEDPYLQLRVEALKRGSAAAGGEGDLSVEMDRRAALSGRLPAGGDATSVPPALEMPAPSTGRGGGGPELDRRVALVRIDRIEIDGVEVTEGAASVVYEPNGRCVPYRVEIVDKFGDGVRVSVDALSASTTERL